MDTRFGQRLERGRRSLLNLIGNADGTRNLTIYAKENCGRDVYKRQVGRSSGLTDTMWNLVVNA